MTFWLSAGIIFTFLSIAFVLVKWGRTPCEGPYPMHPFTFVAILFTSGLDVGLIMFPLTEFPVYADIVKNPEYSFTNPLALEFGFWGFMIWGFYFLTCFYFCILEPRVRFFELKLVKFLNNAVIIGTCAFTAYLLLANLPWYIPVLAASNVSNIIFTGIVFSVIALAVYSSTDLKYVRILSLSSSLLFLALIVLLWVMAFVVHHLPAGEYVATLGLIGGYFANLDHFVLPINDYHEFYLFWWFAWSIMIGQFTARFVGGLPTYQVFLAMVVVPSIPIALWFSILYYYYLNELSTAGLINWTMIFVGITFVVNSLDSLVRLYTDNLNLTVERFGRVKYFIGNFSVLALLTLAFSGEFLEIEWVGAIVIGLYFFCFLYMLGSKRQQIERLN
ncbi:BCCT family transporter [Kordiimonas aestuarii]|uniref:BCCT family transporter n=1 Tax=Kordiimonas aestuarii TaxID=1005925 RepID=UPI00374D8116